MSNISKDTQNGSLYNTRLLSSSKVTSKARSINTRYQSNNFFSIQEEDVEETAIKLSNKKNMIYTSVGDRI